MGRGKHSCAGETKIPDRTSLVIQRHFSVSSKSFIEKWVPVGPSSNGFCLFTVRVVAGLCLSSLSPKAKPLRLYLITLLN